MAAPTEDLRRRTYAEWYVWAKRNLSATPEICHAAAQASVDAAAEGASPQDAARRAAAYRVGPGWAAPAPPAVRAYAEWYDWSRSNLAVRGDDLHRAAAAALDAQDRGADSAGAAAAARAATLTGESPAPVVTEPTPSVATPGSPAPAPPLAPAPPPAAPVTPALAPASPATAYPVSQAAWSPQAATPRPLLQDPARGGRYAEWFAWAHQSLVGDVETSHRAAAGALAAEIAGEDGEAGARVAAVGTVTGAPAAPGERLYAEWFDFLGRHVGAAGAPTHLAAAAAVKALAEGATPDAAVMAGRRAAGLYARPGTEFFKNRWRVALLTIFPLYAFWWLWTVFALSQRERFPRGRSFAWVLVPIADYVFFYRIVADLKSVETAHAGSSAVNPGLITLLLVLEYAANLLTNINNGWILLASFAINWAAAGAAAFMTQTSVNRYLAARYPGARKQRMSNGEIIAVVATLTVLGVQIARSVLGR